MSASSTPPPVPGAPEDPTRTIETITAPGALIGPYRLIRQLGEGGMGVVYHAQQLQPIRREVALKIIKPGMDSKQVVARFESERQALAIMDHANIAHVFDAGATSTGYPYFVMELVDGVPITGYCNSKRLSLRERIKLFIPVCRAVQHAHQKGIIHRDIKPSNLLVAEHEGKPSPKVIDFGLAKALSAQLSDATMMTNFDTIVGTFQYMSPEQAELGRHDIDTRSDVYSLGAVLYDLLAGTPPLEQESIAKSSYVEILRQVRETEPVPPSVRTRRSVVSAETAAQRQTDPAQLARLLGGDLDWIAMKALEKDRTRRYETVNGLARDLERFLDGEPVEAAPPSTTYRLGKFVRKHRAWLATAAAFTALLASGVAVSSLIAVRASRAEQEARAVNDFLQRDLLAQATAYKQTRPDNKPDPDLKVRTVLDRAAAGIGGKFAAQPLVEASIRHTIGEAYVELGLSHEAEHQLELALKLLAASSGEKQFSAVVDMNDLAEVYLDEGRYAEGETLLNKALSIGRRVLGEEHPEVLTSMNDLATSYVRQGKYTEAEQVDGRVLELRRRVLGEDNFETARSMSNLAVIYQIEGKYAKAEALQTKAEEVQRRVSGQEHPFTLRSIYNLAELYRVQGKYAQAEPLYTRVLALRRAVIGEEHPDTLTTMNGLAALYRDEGKYTEADAIYSKVAEARRRVLGEEHPNALDALAELGHVRLLEQKYAEAETPLREALEGNEKTRSEAWQKYYCRSMLGAILTSQRKYAEAEPLLVSGYGGMMQRESTMSAADRFSLTEAGDRIIKLYQGWGKPDKATEWQQKLQETRTANFSNRH